MRMHFLRFLPVLFLLLGVLPGAAAAPASEPAPVTDPTHVAEHYHQIVARPEFQESTEPDVNERVRDLLSQWFTRLGAKFGEFKYTQEMPRFASLLMTLLVLLSIVGLLYAVVRLTRRRQEWDLPAEAEDPVQKTFRPPEYYEEELRRTIAAGDWHAAWLVTWRQFLSRLEREHLVEADRSRTNREYLAQLHAHPQTDSAFALLDRTVDAYDRFIYGRRAITEPDWQAFYQEVNEAALMLHLPERPSPAAKPA